MKEEEKEKYCRGCRYESINGGCIGNYEPMLTNRVDGDYLETPVMRCSIRLGDVNFNSNFNPKYLKNKHLWDKLQLQEK